MTQKRSMVFHVYISIEVMSNIKNDLWLVGSLFYVRSRNFNCYWDVTTSIWTTTFDPCLSLWPTYTGFFHVTTPAISRNLLSQMIFHRPAVLICKLWWLICANLRFVVFPFCRGEKTTKRQDDKTIIIVFSPRKDDKTKSRQNKGEKTTNTTR
jgi:hypothetical protein